MAVMKLYSVLML